MRTSIVGGVLAIGFLLSLAPQSLAEPVAYNFSGTLTSGPPADETRQSLLGLTAGSRFYGTMGWDFNAPPIPEGNGYVYYPYDAGERSQAPTAFFSLWYTLTFETFAILGPSGNQEARVFDLAEGDTLLLHGNVPPDSDPMVSISEVFLSFRFAPDAFSNNDFPATLDPASFLSGHLALFPLRVFNGIYTQDGTIDTFEVAEVPEPPVSTLLGMGLLLFGFCRRDRFRWPLQYPGAIRRGIPCGAVAIVLLLGSAADSSAEPVSISYSFTGTFTSDIGPENLTNKFLKGLTQGSQVTGAFGWEFNQAPLWEGGDGKYDPYRAGGRSEAPDAYLRVWYDLAFDGLTLSGKAGYDTPPAIFSYPRLLVGNTDDFDFVTIFDAFNRTDIRDGDNLAVDFISIAFRFSPDAFSDRAVPSVLDVSKLLPGYTSSVQTHAQPCGEFCNALGFSIDTLSELKQVPEPMTLTLVGVGIAVAAIQRRRTRGDR